MKYLDKKFSTPPNNKAYVDNWDAIFADKPEAPLDSDQCGSNVAFACEVCGKKIWQGWFSPLPGSKVKCGACCNPPRAEAPAPKAAP